MEKIEVRIENLERMERELWGRVDDIEMREEDVEVKLGMKNRVSRVYKPKLIKKQTNDVKRRIERVRRLGSEKLNDRRERMRRQIKDVVKKADDVKEAPVSVEEKSLDEEKKIHEKRKDILKKQVSGVIEKHKDVKKEKKEIPKEIRQLKILTGEEASDARLLFAFLLKRGSVSLEEAVNELDSDKEAIESWAKDLKASGLIDVNVFAGKSVMKLKDISAAVGEKQVD
ncbi:MAG: hypothetical protein L6243_00425 [Candidatus Altiarchaeales archaeon]|nr:hypothetical protein [Candidatus Altiarchaeota archaeon]MBU4341186.1 hypothetical protein [Candidatus Altiarchaeota archaeon]MBU4437717.1 hypothetical protein [Candidatus Altiarchaeota archaeon]MCG2782033.1 hypothetical protein [Candidatus Altiarchaeales archaeon]